MNEITININVLSRKNPKVSGLLTSLMQQVDGKLICSKYYAACMLLANEMNGEFIDDGTGLLIRVSEPDFSFFLLSLD